MRIAQRDALVRMAMHGCVDAAKKQAAHDHGLKHPAVRNYLAGSFPSFIREEVGGLPRLVHFDMLHTVYTGEIPKFFVLLYALVVKYHVHITKTDPEGRAPLRSREDAQHVIEDRLAAIPAMRDASRRSSISLKSGWWTIVRSLTYAPCSSLSSC